MSSRSVFVVYTMCKAIIGIVQHAPASLVSHDEWICFLCLCVELLQLSTLPTAQTPSPSCSSFTDLLEWFAEKERRFQIDFPTAKTPKAIRKAGTRCVMDVLLVFFSVLLKIVSVML